MKNILVHGLGQNNNSWNEVNYYLDKKEIETICPDLFKIVKNDSVDYKNMYEAFSKFCNNQNQKLNLCGLSLGGILALEYAKEYPQNVNSIILIGTPYEIPKIFFKVQSLIFHIMPKKIYNKMGCSKRNFINLVNSMANIEIKKGLENIKCKCLILCGDKDNINIKDSTLLNKSIINSEFKIINNSSHEVNIKNPKELSNFIYDFWKDNQ